MRRGNILLAWISKPVNLLLNSVSRSVLVSMDVAEASQFNKKFPLRYFSHVLVVTDEYHDRPLSL